MLVVALCGCDLAETSQTQKGSEEAVEVGLTEAELAIHIYHESRDDDEAIGDKNLKHKAYGPLQIRQPCVDDVNKRLGTNYRAADCKGNRALSIKIAKTYWSIYAIEKRLGRKPTAADRAAIWNGGPNGYKKKSTKQYREDFEAMKRCQDAGRPLSEWRRFR